MGASEMCGGPVIRLLTSPERVFPVLALVFGALLVFWVPPFQSPDEPAHFFRAYQVSEGVFFPEREDRRLGGDLPVSLVQVRDSFSCLKMNYDARVPRGLIFDCLELPLLSGARGFTDFPNTAIYAPTAYLPQATALALLRPLGASPLLLLYGARLANLLVWVLLVWSAIRLMPFLKNTLAVLALLPASLAVAASANADVVTNGLCWWLVASFSALAHSRAATVRQMAALTLVCANKLIVLPLVLTGLMHRGAAVRRWALLAGVALLAAFGWSRLAQSWFIPYDAYNPAFRDAQTLNEGVDPLRQQAFMLENPLYFAKTAATSAIKALPSAAAHLVGKFGWEKNYLSPLWLALLWLAVAATLVTEKNPLSMPQRLLAVLVFGMYAALFSITMYALWCPVGATEVTNFQGRYFVPVLPVLALALAGSPMEKWKPRIWATGLVILTAGNLALLWSVWARYYG